ncbi:hypothetical protein D3C85_1315940 [compost metagenome]
MVHLRQVPRVRWLVIELSVPEVKDEMNCFRAIGSLKKAFLRYIEISTVVMDDLEQITHRKLLILLDAPNALVDQTIRAATECTAQEGA